MTRKEAKQLFKEDVDAYGKPKKIMHKLDQIFDEFEKKLKDAKKSRNSECDITLEDLRNKPCYQYDHGTIGGLLDFIFEHKLPKTGNILVQRIEDCYYEGSDISGFSGCKTAKDGIFPPGSKSSGWGTVKKKGTHYHDALNWNKKIDGEFNDKEEYPDLDVSKLKKFTNEEIQESLNEYHPIWCPVKFNDDDENLYLDLHY